MITPNKSTPLRDSIAYKMTAILECQFQDIHLGELYSQTKSKFGGLDEFLYSIDVLYILGKIDVDLDLGIVKKC